MSTLDGNPLTDALAVAVPLEIMRLRDATPQQREHLAASLRYPAYKTRPRTPERHAEQAALDALPFSGYPLGGADALMYGGKDAPGAFANWALALALLAYGTGGIRFGPYGWCASHAPGGKRWPDGERTCPGCLCEERATPAPDGGAA